MNRSSVQNSEEPRRSNGPTPPFPAETPFQRDSTAPTAWSAALRGKGPARSLSFTGTSAFTLTYDTTVVGFIDFDMTNSHLSSDGTQLQAIVQENQPGTLTVGLTRTGSTGIDFNGTEPLISIRFSRVAASGTAVLGFANSELFDSNAPQQPIPGIQWFGGTFQVN